jgi:hypothetical protein
MYVVNHENHGKGVLSHVAGVVHVPSFFKEVATLKEKGLSYEDRLFLSDRGKRHYMLITTIF